MEEELIEATMNYIQLDKQQIKPVSVRIKNGRQEKFQLFGDGIQLLQQVSLRASKYHNVDPTNLLKELRADVQAMATRLVDAHYATMVVPLVRSQSDVSQQRNAVENLTTHKNHARPHTVVHNDYTQGFHEFLKSMNPEMLRQFLCVPRTDIPNDGDLLHLVHDAKRVVVVQFWKSIQPPDTLVEDFPLALCLPRSIRSSHHLIPAPLPEYGGKHVGEGFSIYLANSEYAQEHCKRQRLILHDD
jgi:hypothetical protein